MPDGVQTSNGAIDGHPVRDVRCWDLGSIPHAQPFAFALKELTDPSFPAGGVARETSIKGTWAASSATIRVERAIGRDSCLGK